MRDTRARHRLGIAARRVRPVVAAVAAWAAVASADAAWPAGAATLARASAAAGAHWPSSPCRGREVVVWVEQAELDHAHPADRVAADASPANCIVRLTHAARAWSGGRLCSLLAHEFGHLAGRGHTDDPADVMYHGAIPWTEDCARAFPPARAASRRWRCMLERGPEMTFVWNCRRRPAVRSSSRT